ncbi:MAG: DUF2177 family protein [Candidatus Saccharimonadales bacterium]
MQNFLISFISALIPLLAIDGVWLSIMSNRFYSSQIGHLLASSPNLIPAGIFYILYTGALSLLVILPAIEHGHSTLKVLALGAVFGALAYGTYDLTNQATLKDWPAIVSIIDILWSAAMTSVVALIAVRVTGYFI